MSIVLDWAAHALVYATYKADSTEKTFQFP